MCFRLIGFQRLKLRTFDYRHILHLDESVPDKFLGYRSLPLVFDIYPVFNDAYYKVLLIPQDLNFFHHFADQVFLSLVKHPDFQLIELF